MGLGAFLICFGCPVELISFAAGPTFNKDIAPIIFKHCAPCHQPQQPGPFNLLAYPDVQKRAKQIVDVTSRRLMPPWLPEAGYGDFREARRLSDEEIRIISAWTDGGCDQGNEPLSVQPPIFSEGWKWGEPDLVLTLTEPYPLVESGPDVWRSFVIPAPMQAMRYVRAMEFQPGNKAIHHAVIRMDPTPHSRERDRSEPGLGFGGITLPETARPPAGHMLNWLPGRVGYRSPEGLAWPFEAGADVVVQLHMQTTGKPEIVAPKIGFYFTDRAPTNQLLVFPLRVRTLNIPGGESRYMVRDSYTLPIDARVLWVNPHAHFLGREMKGYARLPDQSTRWLFWIKQWNFNWQDDYSFREPVMLPRGSELFMEYVFDNSEGNHFNPTRPPRRVLFGEQSADEMAEMWVQVLPRNAEDRAVFERDFQGKTVREMGDYYKYRLGLNPSDAKAHARLGFVAGSQGRPADAEKHLRKAIELDPKDDDTRMHAGLFWLNEGRMAEAEASLTEAVKLNPANDTALGILGYVLMKQGDLFRAEECLNASLRLNPKGPGVRDNLRRLEQLKARARKPGVGR